MKPDKKVKHLYQLLLETQSLLEKVRGAQKIFKAYCFALRLINFTLKAYHISEEQEYKLLSLNKGTRKFLDNKITEEEWALRIKEFLAQTIEKVKYWLG